MAGAPAHRRWRTRFNGRHAALVNHDCGRAFVARPRLCLPTLTVMLGSSVSRRQIPLLSRTTVNHRVYTLNDETYRLGAAHADADGDFRVTVASVGDEPAREFDVTFEPLGDGVGVLTRGAHRTRVVYAMDGAQVLVHHDGHTYRFARHRGTRRPVRENAGDLTAPMPGVVVAVHVAIGDSFAPGHVLLVLEAMKMQQEVRAPFAGTVAAIHHEPGDQVDAGAHLIDVTPVPEPTA